MPPAANVGFKISNDAALNFYFYFFFFSFLQLLSLLTFQRDG